VSLGNRMRNSVCVALGERWLRAQSAKHPVLMLPLGSHLRVVWWVIRSFTSDFAMADRDDLFCFYMADHAGLCLPRSMKKSCNRAFLAPSKGNSR
jgi:hypothetical protein